MKRVEGDAKRQPERIGREIVAAKELRRYRAEESLQDVQKEGAVFEDDKRNEVGDDAGRYPQPRPPGLVSGLDTQAEPVVHHHHEEDEGDEDGLAPGVEDETEQKQHRLAESRQRVDEHE